MKIIILMKKKNFGVFVLGLVLAFPLSAQSFLEGLNQKGLMLKDWYVRIGAFSTKDNNFYSPELEQYSIYKGEASFTITQKEWQSLSLPLDMNVWEPDVIGKLIAVTLLKEFHLKDLPLDVKNKEISLYIPFYVMNAQVFLNGKKIAENGQVSLSEQKYKTIFYRRHWVVPIPRKFLKEKNELCIVIYSIPPDPLRVYGESSGFSMEINYLTEHLKIYNETISFMLLFLYFFVGAYHLLLFYKRPKELYNLWFGLFSVSLSLYYITRTSEIYYWFDDSFLITKIEYSLVFFASIVFPLFYENFHFRRQLIIGKVISIIVFLLILSVWIFPSYYTVALQILRYWQYLSLIVAIYSMGIVIYFTFWKKNKDSLRLLIGVIILCTAVILDILGAMDIGLQNYQLARYGFFIFLIGIAFVLANKFLRVYREVEELNLHLEEKVKERTKELQLSLEQIQKLKEQQDGDYFLTSLLIQPLIYEDIHSEVVSVQSFLKQKKEFRFRKWEREIGGDICIAQSLTLQNKPYIFVFNGDAMGKSLQGAGGALVAGVVIKAILTRTLLYSEYQNRYPEQWLKELFLELHKVFESFDGSMLLSGCLGLLEENTGTFYFIYAEHPYPVIYRDKKAEFLDNTTEFKKFGTPGVLGKVYILVKKLQPNDMIFIGSDGKDDLIMQQNGQEVINEDETLFLRIVEKSDGDVESIIKQIQETGKLMDDISIMKIAYKEGEWEEPYSNSDISLESIKKEIVAYKKEQNWDTLKEYLEEKTKSIHGVEWLTKELILAYYKLKQYSDVIREGEQYLEAYPYDDEVLFMVSRSYIMKKDYEKALSLAERLDLRNPKNVLNLIHLTDCYRLLGDSKKAIKVLNRLLDIAPEREEAKKLKRILLGY